MRVLNVTQAYKHWLTFSLVLALVGCASTPSQNTTLVPIQVQHLSFIPLSQIEQFEMSAKIGVQHAGKGYSARLTWQHQEAQDALYIFSPLGQQVANIQRDTTGVTLITQDQQPMSAQNVADLTEQTLGWRLPLEGLSAWALGMPATGSEALGRWNTQAQLAQLAQDGWQIEFDDYREQTDASKQHTWFLPNTINLSRQDLRLKLRVQSWQVTARTKH